MNFYVALTRAKEKVYLIPDGNPSSFITELEGKEYNVGIYGSSDNPNKIKCPKCNDGYLVERDGKFGKFYGCSNYPKCTYTKDINGIRDKYNKYKNFENYR